MKNPVSWWHSHSSSIPQLHVLNSACPPAQKVLLGNAALECPLGVRMREKPQVLESQDFIFYFRMILFRPAAIATSLLPHRVGDS